jgi:hypothetical protein
LTRFNLGNAHAWGLSNHGAYVGSANAMAIRRHRENTSLPRFGPLVR